MTVLKLVGEYIHILVKLYMFLYILLQQLPLNNHN